MTAGGGAPGAPDGDGGAGGDDGGLYSVREGNYRRTPMLNICDAELVGTVVEEPGSGGRAARRLPIKASYYGGRRVDRDEAVRMMAGAQIINMAGRRAVGLAVGMGLGSDRGVKSVGGVPFLIVFR